jgi:hypothetical protein
VRPVPHLLSVWATACPTDSKKMHISDNRLFIPVRVQTMTKPGETRMRIKPEDFIARV